VGRAVDELAVDLSAAEIVAAFVVSTVGFGLFLYGKKERRVPQLVAGLAMMLGPYVVGGATPTWLLGAASVLGLAAWSRMSA
jgi:hypothetical protein